MLRLAVPKLRRVGFLVDGGLSADKSIKVFQRVAAQYRIESRFSIVSKADGFERAFMHLRDEKIEGLVIHASAFLTYERQRIVDRALKERWPAIAGDEILVDAGVLMGYGPNFREISRRAATYVDKILKGANPAELPIEQPMRIDLVVNMKTAKALGIKLSDEIMARAERFVE